MPTDRIAVDRVPYLRARRLARIVTVAVVLVQAGLIRTTTVLAGADGASPLAILPFLAVCGVFVGAWFLLSRLWGRVMDLRPLTLPLDAGDGALQGAPERDGAAGRHLSLSGEVDPPRRW